jgi:hypothetical protein
LLAVLSLPEIKDSIVKFVKVPEFDEEPQTYSEATQISAQIKVAHDLTRKAESGVIIDDGVFVSAFESRFKVRSYVFVVQSFSNFKPPPSHVFFV